MPGDCKDSHRLRSKIIVPAKGIIIIIIIRMAETAPIQKA